MKRVLSAICLGTVMLSAIMLAGCGEKKGDVQIDTEYATTAPSSGDAIDLTIPETTEALLEETKSSTAKYKNIEEYVNDPVIKEQLDKVINSMSSSQFTISVETENDNVLVYKYVFQRELSDAQRKAVAEQIEKSLSSYDSIYNSLVDTLKKDVDVDNPKVRLVYETSDGQKITDYYRYYAIVGVGDDGTPLPKTASVINLRSVYLQRLSGLNKAVGPWVVYAKGRGAYHSIAVQQTWGRGEYPFYLEGAPPIKCSKPELTVAGAVSAVDLIKSEEKNKTWVYTKAGAATPYGMTVKRGDLTQSLVFTAKPGKRYGARVYVPQKVYDALPSDAEGNKVFTWANQNKSHVYIGKEKPVLTVAERQKIMYTVYDLIIQKGVTGLWNARSRRMLAPFLFLKTCCSRSLDTPLSNATGS